jgi:hypothetical protein
LRLESLGYDIRLANHLTGAIVPDGESLPVEKLARSEHRRWMRLRLLHGYAWAEQSNDALFLHKDICGFDSLPEKESRLDHGIIAAVFEFMKEKGLALIKSQPLAKQKSSPA